MRLTPAKWCLDTMRPFTVLTLCLMPSDLSVDFPLWTPLCDGRDGRSSFLQRSRLVQGACPETGAKRANQPAVCNLLGLKATCCEGLRCWLVLKHSNPTIGYAQDLGYSIWVMNIATGRQDERSSIVVRGHGVLSPDGSRVVRCDESLHLIDGESQLRIVDKGWGVAWSPDGTRFVYCREDGLYVTDGTHRERVAVVKASTTHWSPDGSMNAYCVWDKGLFVVKADGTAQRRLVSGYVGDANWAPDGSAVAYTVSCEGIFAVKLGGTVKRFTDHPGDGSPVWSPPMVQASLTYADTRVKYES